MKRASQAGRDRHGFKGTEDRERLLVGC